MGLIIIYYLLFSSLLKKEFTIDKTMANNKAYQKLSIVNPGTTKEAREINAAFIIKINKPKVKIVIGKVRIIKMGLIKEFIPPSTTAKIKAVIKPET
jgi:hypothetical protein